MRESLRTRRMNHKFHYDSPKQAVKWLRLHEAYSPARQDPSCLGAYESGFAAVASLVSPQDTIEIISLGCGGGQKDAQLIQAIKRLAPGAGIHVVSVDVSAALTLVARNAAIEAGALPADCTPIAIDLARAKDWADALSPALRKANRRVVTFFGMLPNFTPSSVLPQLAKLLCPDDLLLISANLAPGENYAAGVEQILPLYDNALTRDWLLTVLVDLGAREEDGQLDFRIVPCPEGSGLLRIQVDFVFKRKCEIVFAGESFGFNPGNRIQLFFSYRHTPLRVSELFREVGITLRSTWTNKSGDEGVFLGERPTT